MKKTLLSLAVMCASIAASAQANFWNLNGSYIDCTTNPASAGTLSSTSYPLYLYQADASSFAIPGLCNTYCNLSFGGPGRATTIVINHITEGSVPSIPGFTAGVKQISTSTVYSDDASYAAGQLKPDGSRVIYARIGTQIVQMCTISATGAVSGSPTVLYTSPPPGGVTFDRWTEMEVSSDGQYLLLVGADALSVGVFNLAANTLTAYPAPGGGSNRIQGFELVNMATPRLYVSYNNRSAANPTGTGGVAYYSLGNTTTYTTVTTSVGFGFSEIELAKNGLLYLAYGGTSPAYNFSNAGTVYSLSTSGTLTATSYTVPASNNVSYSAYCNKYYIQKQIDGENYDAGSYVAPTVIPTTVKLSNVIGFTGPSPSTPTVYTCQPELLPLECTFTGLTSGYELTITKGAISGTSFIPDGTTPLVYTKTAYYANSISGVMVPSSFVLPGWNNSDWKIQIRPTGTCVPGTIHTVYYRVRKPIVDAYTPKLKGIAGAATPSVSATPTIYRCGTEPLSLNFTLTGSAVGYDVKVTKGTIGAGDIFTPAGGADNVTQSVTDASYYASYTLLPASFVPDAFVGSDWKVEITPKSACGTGTVNVSYYKVRSATATVDFLVRSPYCTSGTQTRTTTVGGIATLGTVSAPVCSQGNLGANSAGFFPPTVSTTSAPTNFSVRVEEVDASGAPLSVPNVIVNYSSAALPVASYYGMADYSLTPASAGYFISNYPTVKGSKIFKLTVGITTTECGLTSAYSYFKIMDDGLTGPYTAGAFWKTAEDGALAQQKVVEVNVMPNPATNNVKVAWFVSEGNDQKTHFSLIDVLGKEVLHQQWAEQKGTNEQSINIEQLSSGMYYYRLETGGTVKSGKLIKE